MTHQAAHRLPAKCCDHVPNTQQLFCKTSFCSKNWRFIKPAMGCHMWLMGLCGPEMIYTKLKWRQKCPSPIWCMGRVGWSTIDRKWETEYLKSPPSKILETYPNKLISEKAGLLDKLAYTKTVGPILRGEMINIQFPTYSLKQYNSRTDISAGISACLLNLLGTQTGFHTSGKANKHYQSTISKENHVTIVQ